MRVFDPTCASSSQRKDETLLAVAVGEFRHQGPYATKHGHPFYLLPIEGQTLSIRLTRKKGHKPLFIIYQRFGEYCHPQPRVYAHSLDEARSALCHQGAIRITPATCNEGRLP